MARIIGYHCKCPYCGVTKTFNIGEEHECPNCMAMMDIVQELTDGEQESSANTKKTAIKWVAIGAGIIAAAAICIGVISSLSGSKYGVVDSPSTPHTVSDYKTYTPLHDVADVMYGKGEYVIRTEKESITIPRPAGMEIDSYTEAGDYPRVSFVADDRRITITYSLDYYESIEQVVKSMGKTLMQGTIGDKQYCYSIDSYEDTQFIDIHQDINGNKLLEILIMVDNGTVSNDFIQSIILPESYYLQ